MGFSPAVPAGDPRKTLLHLFFFFSCLLFFLSFHFFFWISLVYVLLFLVSAFGLRPGILGLGSMGSILEPKMQRRLQVFAYSGSPNLFDVTRQVDSLYISNELCVSI